MSLLLMVSILFADITKEEIIQLSREGVSDDAIIAKIREDKSRFQLSADEVVELKKAGVSDTVIRAMFGSGLQIENRSHRGVRIHVDAERKAIHLLDQGIEVARKETAELDAPDGTYAVWIDGKKTSYKITTPVKLTVRGNNLTEMEVLTAYVGEGKSAKTFLILARDK